MRYLIPCAWILLAPTVCLAQTSTLNPTFSTDQFSLLTKANKFALQFSSNGKRRQIAIPREWLVPPDEEKEEIGNYVSSFGYDPPITSFAIGNGQIGLHLSSYDVTREGTSHAAAGRDVFLLFDPQSLAVSNGGIQRGVTKWRVRSEGCISAAAEHYLLGDVNGDGLMDIGVVKEEIECVDKVNQAEDKEWREPHYKQYSIDWYVLRGNTWQLDTSYSGKIPGVINELPLIGSASSDVNEVPLAMWRSFDPSQRLELDGPPPAYIPPYWKSQVTKQTEAEMQPVESSHENRGDPGSVLKPEIHTITVRGITAHFGGEKPQEEFVDLRFGVEELWFTFEGDPKQYLFRSAGQLFFSDWSFDIFSPDGAYVLLLQDHYGPYHVIASNRLKKYLMGNAKPDYVLTQVVGPMEPARVHHNGRWVTTRTIQFQVSCCG